MTSHQQFKNALQIAAEAMQQASIFWEEAQQEAVKNDTEEQFLQITQGNYPKDLPDFCEMTHKIYTFSNTINKKL